MYIFMHFNANLRACFFDFNVFTQVYGNFMVYFYRAVIKEKACH